MHVGMHAQTKIGTGLMTFARLGGIICDIVCTILLMILGEER